MTGYLRRECDVIEFMGIIGTVEIRRARRESIGEDSKRRENFHREREKRENWRHWRVEFSVTEERRQSRGSRKDPNDVFLVSRNRPRPAALRSGEFEAWSKRSARRDNSGPLTTTKVTRYRARERERNEAGKRRGSSTERRRQIERTREDAERRGRERAVVLLSK